MSNKDIQRIHELESSVEKNVQNVNGTDCVFSITLHRYNRVDEGYE